MNPRTIWIIDDDGDDHDLIREIFAELQLDYNLEFFLGAEPVLERIQQKKESPFIIICDVNLPKINGFQLRERLLDQEHMENISVPFIFWSNYATSAQIKHAYQLKAHGFFIKEHRYQDWKATFINIIKYWQKSQIPDE